MEGILRGHFVSGGRGQTGQYWSCERSAGLSTPEWVLTRDTWRPPKFTFTCGLRGRPHLTDGETKAECLGVLLKRVHVSKGQSRVRTQPGTFHPQAGVFPLQPYSLALNSSFLSLTRAFNRPPTFSSYPVQLSLPTLAFMWGLHRIPSDDRLVHRKPFPQPTFSQPSLGACHGLVRKREVGPFPLTRFSLPGG